MYSAKHAVRVRTVGSTGTVRVGRQAGGAVSRKQGSLHTCENDDTACCPSFVLCKLNIRLLQKASAAGSPSHKLAPPRLPIQYAASAPYSCSRLAPPWCASLYCPRLRNRPGEAPAAAAVPAAALPPLAPTLPAPSRKGARHSGQVTSCPAAALLHTHFCIQAACADLPQAAHQLMASPAAPAGGPSSSKQMGQSSPASIGRCPVGWLAPASAGPAPTSTPSSCWNCCRTASGASTAPPPPPPRPRLLWCPLSTCSRNAWRSEKRYENRASRERKTTQPYKHSNTATASEVPSPRQTEPACASCPTWDTLPLRARVASPK